VVRLVHGIVERPPSRKIGKVEVENFDAQFKEKKFPDGERYKFLCPMCSYEHSIIEEDSSDFTELLQRLDIGWCCLCGQPIEAWPDPQYASAVMIQRGTVARNKDYDPQAEEEIYVGRSSITVPNPNANPIKFTPLGGGTVHYLCMDDLGIELWALIETTDEPDYSWPE